MNILETHSERRVCLAELRRRIGVIERDSLVYRSKHIDQIGLEKLMQNQRDSAPSTESSECVGALDIRSAGALKEASLDQNAAGHFSSLMVPSGADMADQLDLDQALGRETMTRPAFHELVADGYGSQPAVRDFSLALAASLLHRQAGAESMVLWCQRRRDEAEFGRLHGPGLLDFGLSSDRLIMVTGRRDADCLWAMEQGLSSQSLAAVIGVVDRADLIASRRLSLAASAHRTCCLLLPSQHGREPSAARTRWRVRTAPSSPDHLDEKGLGRPCWQLTLERCRNGQTGQWTVEWDHAAHRFHLATPMAHQPMAGRHGPNKEVAEQGSWHKEDSGVIVFGHTG